MLFYDHFKAPNDTNGNPRRLFVVRDANTMDVVDVVKEGYAGRGAVQRKYPEAVEGITVDIAAKTYNGMLREWKTRNRFALR